MSFQSTVENENEFEEQRWRIRTRFSIK